jgi:hypothetical protein
MNYPYLIGKLIATNPKLLVIRSSGAIFDSIASRSSEPQRVYTSLQSTYYR